MHILSASSQVIRCGAVSVSVVPATSSEYVSVLTFCSVIVAMTAPSEEGDLSESVIKSLTWGVVSREYEDDAHLVETNGVFTDHDASSVSSNDFGPSPAVSDDKKNRILR